MPSLPVSWLTTELTLPVSALTAPISVLLAMFSRWPLYLSHGPVHYHRPSVSQIYLHSLSDRRTRYVPAAEMWSVVHLPWTLINTAASRMSFSPFGQGANGSYEDQKTKWGASS